MTMWAIVLLQFDKIFLGTYTGQAEEDFETPGLKDFAETQSTLMQGLKGPKFPQSSAEKAKQKEEVLLLEEFKADLVKLSELFGMPLKELIKTKGRLSNSKKFKSKLIFN